jgi:hypothetical protein
MKTEKIRNFVLSLMIVIFAFLIVSIFGLNERLRLRNLPIPALVSIAVSFFLLGIFQVIVSIKIHEAKLKKIFSVLAGGSALMIPICAILHNVVYGLFFAGKQGDEAVFFILAVIICPALFAISALGTIICGIKGTKRRELENAV